MIRRRLSRRGDAEGEGDTINLSPLIDMTFLLLIFFVVSSTLVDDAEIPIERPSASSGSSVDASVVRVTVGAEALAVAGEPVSSWMLGPTVRARLAEIEDPRVLVVTDRSVAAERLVRVVDECRLAGAMHVGVAVEAEP